MPRRRKTESVEIGYDKWKLKLIGKGSLVVAIIIVTIYCYFRFAV